MKKLQKLINYQSTVDSLLFLSLIYIFFSLLFSRSFVGIYVIGFRIGEIFMFLSLISFIFFLFLKNKQNILTKNLQIIFGLMLISFFFVVFISNSSLLDTYTFRTSTYIWSLGFLMLGIHSRKLSPNKFYLSLLFGILITTYLVAILDFPNFVQNIFLNYSDKYEPHKAADIVLIILIFSTYLNNYFKNSFNSLAINFLVFSLFLPLLLYKSRASFISCIIYFFYVVFENRKIIKSNILKVFLILLPCLVIMTSSTILSQRLVIQEYSIEEISGSYSSLGQYKFDTYQEEERLFYIENGRLYSADGNLNWRLRMWQDQIIFTLDDGNILSGVGYKEILKVFIVETPPKGGDVRNPGSYGNDRRGLDGLNENLHNYFLTIFARGGLIHFSIFILFYIFLIFNVNKSQLILFLSILFSILFVSSFDSSMENAHFPLIFHFFVGNYFFNINLKS